MRTLVRKADVITPNLTEALLLLYGEDEMKKRMKSYAEMKREQMLEEIRQIGKTLAGEFDLDSLVITGVDVEEEDGVRKMGNLVVENRETRWFF